MTDSLDEQELLDTEEEVSDDDEVLANIVQPVAPSEIRVTSKQLS